MHKAEGSKCPCCNEDPETIVHAFIECSYSVRVWKYVEHLVKRTLDKYKTISDSPRFHRMTILSYSMEKCRTFGQEEKR